MSPNQKRPSSQAVVRRRWRLEERLEASSPRRRWFSTFAGLLAVVDLYVFPSSPVLSSLVSIGAGIVLLLAAGMSLEDAT